MKKPLVFILLALLLVAFVGLAVFRNLGQDANPGAQWSHFFADSKQEQAPVVGSTGDGKDAGRPPVDAAEPAKNGGLNRPLQVIGLGWELLAPGILGNGGLTASKKSAFTEAGVQVRLQTADDMAGIERALAHGGQDATGADVAILPLPEWVASYEKMRALKPEVFFVVGWSNGREGLAATAEQSLTNLPTKRDIRVRGQAGSSSAFLSLFVLQAAGVSVDRMQLVDPKLATSATAPFAAVSHSSRKLKDGSTERRMLLTTADASKLIPFVAVAPRGFINSHGQALRLFCGTWLVATHKMRGDVPSAARLLASEKGAPETVELLDRLGWIELSSLRDNAQTAALSGRSAVTIDELFHRTWSIWRGAGLLSTPAPQVAPVSGEIITALVRDKAELSGTGSLDPPTGKNRTKTAKTPVLLKHHFPRGTLDNEALVREVGFLAKVFSHSPIKVLVRGKKKQAQTVTDAVVARFGIPPKRLTVGISKGKTPASIEVRSAP